MRTRSRVGFSLVEIVISVSIIAIIVAFIAVSVNPGKRLAASRNTVRRKDAAAIADAVSLSVAKGAKLQAVDKTLRMIGTATTGCSRRCGNLDGYSEGFAFNNDASYGVWFQRTFFEGTSITPELNLTGTRTFSAWVKSKSIIEFSGVISKFGGVGGYGIFTGSTPYHDASTGFIRILDASNTADAALLNQIVAEKKANMAIGFFSGLNMHILSTIDYPIKVGEYQHLAVTFDPAGGTPVIRLFVDGIARPTATTQNFVSNNPNYSGAAGAITIGGLSLPFVGTVGSSAKTDDVGIYDRILADAEIATLADGDDISSSRIAFWEFNEGTGRYADATPVNPNLRLRMPSIAVQQGVVEKLWDDDEALLPVSCVNLDLTKTPVAVPKMPIGPKVSGGKYIPDATRTFYAVARGASVTARSCLAESESGTVLPIIDVSR